MGGVVLLTDAYGSDAEVVGISVLKMGRCVDVPLEKGIVAETCVVAPRARLTVLVCVGLVLVTVVVGSTSELATEELTPVEVEEMVDEVMVVSFEGGRIHSYPSVNPYMQVQSAAQIVSPSTPVSHSSPSSGIELPQTGTGLHVAAMLSYPKKHMQSEPQSPLIAPRFER